MEKIIKLDLLRSEDFFEVYNRENVSRALVDYLVTEGYHLKKKDRVKIIISDSMNEKINCTKLIKEGLKRGYNICYRRRQKIMLKQLIYLVVGAIILFLSTLINSETLKEIVLIFGWVLVWTMVELEIFNDVDNKKKCKILKKLLNSEFIENEL